MTDPNGIVLDAAVRSAGSNVSPFAVGRPAKPGPYHEAVREVQDGFVVGHAAKVGIRTTNSNNLLTFFGNLM